MKNKTFLVRMMNLIVVVLLLMSYQFIVKNREQEESAAYKEYQEALELAGNTIEQESNQDEGRHYKDGVYTGTGDGFGGTIEVQVTISEGSITDIEILEAEGEDKAYLTMAQFIIEDMMRSQTTKVDAISGATYSSMGIKQAVENALEGSVD